MHCFPSTKSSTNRHAYFSSDSKALPVGFIGLGNMGMGMASNLHKRGIPVVAVDSNEKAIAEASNVHGMSVVSHAKCLISGPSPSPDPCHVIFTMLPGCGAVDAVMSDLVEARGAARTDSGAFPLIIVDCSTVSPSTSRNWHDRWQSEGVDFIDAPVSGGVKGAAEATLVRGKFREEASC
jgi:3-hydroxyisobutyrate dehydrogenase-like beta-hydroxyacid dehydrogenase